MEEIGLSKYLIRVLAAVKTRAHPAAGSFWWDNGH
jgi:hypothetical protein